MIIGKELRSKFDNEQNLTIKKDAKEIEIMYCNLHLKQHDYNLNITYRLTIFSMYIFSALNNCHLFSNLNSSTSTILISLLTNLSCVNIEYIFLSDFCFDACFDAFL